VGPKYLFTGGKSTRNSGGNEARQSTGTGKERDLSVVELTRIERTTS
jgi:hypothetical protein